MVRCIVGDVQNQWRLMFDPLFDICLAFKTMVNRFLDDMHTLRRLMLDHLFDSGSTLDEMVCRVMENMHHLRKLMLHHVFDTGLSFNMMYQCLRYDTLMTSMLDHLLDVSLTFDKMVYHSMDARHHLRKLIPDRFLILESTLLAEAKTLDRIPVSPTDVESCVDKVSIWSFGRGQTLSQFFQALSTIWTMSRKRRTFTWRCNETLNSPQSSVPSPAKVIKPRKRYLFEGIKRLLCREIKRQNEDLRQKLNCQECKEKPRCVVFLPCRHILLCSDCAAYVEKKCPTCKRDIEEKIVVQR
ncbi:hypothetical protein ACJMK2_028440 [Sinanodonta woodiana]|uniref:RING-type domain-containing protein n=1 Tax=Sinanodonta woodiana TaxID=1069815 RepID=A0ABD3X7H6_SINWO